MGSHHSSAPTAHADFGINLPIRVCRRRTPSQNREGKTMHAATTRSIIAAAGLAAIGLVAWPHQATPPQAQQGVPTVHRDVALVDDSSTILPPETSFDTELFNSVFGTNGAEEQFYNALATAVGAPEAQTLLDTNTADPVYSGIFNGAESRLFEGLFLNTLVGEDSLNQALGITPTASETELLSVFNTDFVPIPGSTDITATDLASAVGTSTFDTDLTTIANADYSLALGDFEGFLSNLATDTSGLSDVSTLLTDLSSSFSDLSTSLTPDLSAILADLSGGLL